MECNPQTLMQYNTLRVTGIYKVKNGEVAFQEKSHDY